MDTEILRPTAPADFERAADLIRGGALVAFPTETVYGLGANGLDAAACTRIYEAKGRPSDNPLILHIADLMMAYEIASDVPPTAAHLLTAFAPGPLTVILPKAAHIPDIVTGGLATVGVRCPDNIIARHLILGASESDDGGDGLRGYGRAYPAHPRRWELSPRRGVDHR